jgi:hypothetical protein
MVLQKNAVIAPFLGDRLSFIRGLDPLGLQNTSQAAFLFPPRVVFFPPRLVF